MSWMTTNMLLKCLLLFYCKSNLIPICHFLFLFYPENALIDLYLFINIILIYHTRAVFSLILYLTSNKLIFSKI